MRNLALGAAFVAATGCLAVPVVGLAGSAGNGGGLLRIPPAGAEELPAFSDCDELLDWYVERALPLVGPWGFSGPYWGGPVVMQDGFGTTVELDRVAGEAAAAAATDATDRAYNSATGTNVQEAGVDEPDVAKTDGSLVLHVDERDLVVTDVTGRRPAELSRTRLPKGFHGDELLLVGDTVLVTGGTTDRWAEPGFADRSVIGYHDPNTRVVAYSVGDAASPVLLDDREYEGTLVEARQYGGTVRLVIGTGLPQLDFVQPNRRRTEREARQENRDIVRDSTIEDWLPSEVSGGERSPLVECREVRHPRTDAGFGTLSIVTFRAATPEDHTTVAVTTSGHLAYSSSDRLYVATPTGRDVEPCIDCGFWGRTRIAPEAAPATTEVHAFELDGTSTTYVASGTVRGQVRDRWSFDEHDGYLRVATALSQDWRTTDNAVSVLRERGAKLEVVGSVRQIGPNEEIQSVRWFDDLAVVVTFRQIDPLYTIDLTEPTDPTVLGELKIPGFSSYLHPIGDDRLLGLGTAATNRGRTLGAQMATFDISNLKDPKQLSVLRLGREEQLNAAHDPRAFTFVGSNRAFTTVSDWNGDTRILQLSVTGSGRIRQLDEHPARYDARILPIDEDRVAFVGDVVRLVDVR